MCEFSEEDMILLKIAHETMKNAHILWGFGVGAAVLGGDGHLYQGCNIQSWVSGLGVCAERCAIDHAVLHGAKKIKKIAVVIDAKHVEKPRPCGACLQYIAEFSEDDTKIVMAKAKDCQILPESIEVKTIKEMLPYRFEIKETQ